MRWWKAAAWTVAGTLGAAAASGTIGARMFAAPRYRGPATDHFDGQRFKNQIERPHGGAAAFLKWQLSRQAGPWQDRVDAPPGPPPPRRVGPGELRVTFVNHASVLIQMDGLNILTDPIWSDRCSPVSWAGPHRHRPPGLRFEDLPPVDAVLVSHNHYDHLDLPTLRRLMDAHHPRIVTGLGNLALLTREGIAGASELDWWHEAPLGPGVRVTAVPAQHFSGRGLGDSDANLWAGFVLSGAAGVVYFAGDTGAGPHFQQIRARFGPPRLAVLPIGAFRPEWFMSHVHIGPAEALQAHRTLGAGTSVAMHFGTFRLADDGQDEAPERLRALVGAVGGGGDPPRFWVLGFGEGRDVPAWPER